MRFVVVIEGEDAKAVLLEAKVIAVHSDQLYLPEEGICVVEKDGKRYLLCSTETGWWLEEGQ